MGTVKTWLRQITEIALILVALGVVLQTLFPKTLVSIKTDLIGSVLTLAGMALALIGAFAVAIVFRPWLRRVLYEMKHFPRQH